MKVSGTVLDIRIVYGEMNSVAADCIICPLDKDFLVPDSSCNSLVDRIGIERIYESYSLKQTKAKVSVSVLKIPDPQIADRMLFFPVFFEEIKMMKLLPILNRMREYESIAIPLVVKPEDLSAEAWPLRHFLRVLFSDHPHFPKKIKQIVLVTCDNAVFEYGKRLINEYEELRRQRGNEKALQQKESMLRKSIDRRKLIDCIILLLNINKAKWSMGREVEEEARNFGYPNYMCALGDVFGLMDIDSDYSEHAAEIRKLALKPNQLSLLQIQAYLTWLRRGEYFCGGMLKDDVEKGILLSVLFRLYELLDSEQYWVNWI